MYPLHLNVNPKGWRTFTLRKQNPNFIECRHQVWQRDQFRCQYCGIVLKQGLEVVNQDGCYTHNPLPNLVTACPLCAQCGFLESLGMSRYGGGTLIYLPEFNQADLNGICHALFQSMAQDNENQAMAQNYYRTLKIRSQIVETQLGTGMSDPAVLGQLLVESNFKPKKETFIANLRLLASFSVFKSRIEHWIHPAL